jgi:hypothetical protein
MMMASTGFRIGLISLAVAVSVPVAPAAAAAAVVASSLPYQNTPNWTDVVFSGTSMVTNGTSSTLTTAQNVGVWFGWSSSSNTPAWTPVSDTAGNYFSMTASFGSVSAAGPADWSAYFYDKTHYFGMTFNPTGCGGTSNCYGVTPASGVQLIFGQAGAQTTLQSQFVSLDIKQSHDYEVLLKGGEVWYRIDGQVYHGPAYQSALSTYLLVVGDGSGTTMTGLGSMRVTGVSFETAPAALALLSSVPEPMSWAMMIVGFGFVGGALRTARPNAFRLG